MLVHQLLRPWAYLSIHGQKKWFFDWMVPAIITTAFMCIFFITKGKLNFYYPNGVVASITAFVQNLPGFFIAALAAVATFNRADLDKKIPDPPLMLPVINRGMRSLVTLTRRRFLSAMFSFLTAQSIVITLLGITYIQAAPVLSQLNIDCWIKTLLSFSGVAIYMIVFFQMLTVSCLGLYYLGDRIHQPENL